MSEYAELHCLSNFSFQRGASSAHALFERVKKCGYTALAITDECSLAGIVRALEASRETGVPLIVGTELMLCDGPKLVLLAETKEGYTSICRLITQGRRSSEKGTYRLSRSHLEQALPGVFVLWVPGRDIDRSEGEWVHSVFYARAWLAIELHKDGEDDTRLEQLEALAAELGMRCVAAGDVHMSVRRCLPLQHTMTAIRQRSTLAEAAGELFRNAERHLRKRVELGRI
jgi:error-prone DNA polymerase